MEKPRETGEYQYTAWPVEKESTENPALVLINGQIKYDGSGTNHCYEFLMITKGKDGIV